MEERKIKIGGKEKVEVAHAQLKDHVSTALSTFEENLLEASTFKEMLSYDKEMLSYNKRLMQKLQLKEKQKLNKVAGAKVSEVD